MNARTSLAALIVLSAVSASFAQSGDEPRGDRGGRGGRGGPPWGRGWGGDENQRREMQERMERYRAAGPEERREMDLDFGVMMATRTYNLSDEQKTTVRNEMRRMSDERRTLMGGDYERSQQLREQMGQYWRRQMEGNQSGDSGAWEAARNDPKFQELRDQMREIDRKYPMNWDEMNRRIESVLPAEQAEEGRKRREEFMRNWGNGQNRGDRNREDRGDGNRDNRDGRDDNRERRFDRRERGSDDGDRGDRGERRRRRDRSDGDRGDRSRMDDRRRSDGPTDDARNPVEPVAPRPLTVTPNASAHAWDTYTERFIADYQLDRTQSTSAWSIVKTLKDREAGILKAQVSDRAAAAKMLNATEKQNRIKKLDEPIDALFKELKNRLNALLTDKQRRATSL